MYLWIDRNLKGFFKWLLRGKYFTKDKYKMFYSNSQKSFKTNTYLCVKNYNFCSILSWLSILSITNTLFKYKLSSVPLSSIPDMIFNVQLEFWLSDLIKHLCRPNKEHIRCKTVDPLHVLSNDQPLQSLFSSTTTVWIVDHTKMIIKPSLVFR